MRVAVLGINHQSGPIELRERLHFTQEMLPEALACLQQQLGGAGVVILSTCNRVEMYVHVANGLEGMRQALQAFLCRWHEVPLQELREHLYFYTGTEAVTHLFKVSASLDSLVLGEDQILGQVHDAYLTAHACETTDKILNNLFTKAFSVAKAVRHKTAIAKGKVSVGSVAVDLAMSIFGNLTGKTVLIIGSGKMSEVTLSRLAECGVGRVLVANRSRENAEKLVQRFEGAAISIEDIDAYLAEADIVISSTASPQYILKPHSFAQALKRRGKHPLFVIDIAMPRDIDPAVNALDNVYLYHVDDLYAITSKQLEQRKTELDHCMALVHSGVESFRKWEECLVAEPTIVSMIREVNQIRERELEKTLAALPGLSEKQQEEVAYLSKRVVNAILQQPMQQIKQEVVSQDPGKVLSIVHRLFGLKETA